MLFSNYFSITRQLAFGVNFIWHFFSSSNQDIKFGILNFQTVDGSKCKLFYNVKYQLSKFVVNKIHFEKNIYWKILLIEI